MKQTEQQTINDFFVENFYKILMLEEKKIREDFGENLSIRELHLIEAVGELAKTKTNKMTNIADKLYITVSALTTAANVLVNKGYLSRVYDPTDRRKVFLRLTETGERAYNFHAGFHDELIGYVEATLTPEEVQTLTVSLQKLSVFFEKLL